MAPQPQLVFLELRTPTEEQSPGGKPCAVAQTVGFAASLTGLAWCPSGGRVGGWVAGK